MDEVKEEVATEPVTPAPVVATKRKYVKLSDSDFLKATHKVDTVLELAALTGMSYGGVRQRLFCLQARKVAIKKCLLERQGRKKA